jgi:magnesium chelatase subunit I
VREEVHENLVRKIRAGEELFPGIIGYQDTVVAELERAHLAGQNVIVLGERGQAKSRLVRSMTSLLDDELPIVAGSDLNDDPCHPVSAIARNRVSEKGDDTPIEWIPSSQRYGEKLATPDVSMADLIGDVDPIKIAEGRYLGDELTIHYGLVPRTNRGIFCVNELPDLPERIQVGLFNLMEERDIQIRGYMVRLPVDVLIFATANPEDYTNRGRIITPLKDRFGAQVRTHYPKTVEQELQIVEQERSKFEGSDSVVVVPAYMSEVVAELTRQARSSPEVNQRSGVSVRVSIANDETLRAAAYRRALQHDEKVGAPRITDLPAVMSSMRGKIELETFDDRGEDSVIEQLTRKAVLEVFNRKVDNASLSEIVQAFSEGASARVGANISANEYEAVARDIPGMAQAVKSLYGSGSQAETASAVEFILEGLHLNRRLNRNVIGGGYSYSTPAEPARDMGLDAELRERLRRRHRRMEE